MAVQSVAQVIMKWRILRLVLALALNFHQATQNESNQDLIGIQDIILLMTIA